MVPCKFKSNAKKARGSHGLMPRLNRRKAQHQHGDRPSIFTTQKLDLFSSFLRTYAYSANHHKKALKQKKIHIHENVHLQP